ncbi:barstar family protein [Amycolatopsis methanolica]|uniref:Barstar (Barnase inhibitor) n=1 Tax=Amycolatopsis methanolica 239 TaxID=1068978 RepID=A0A076MZZ1_AMYME|nr:barstar family protein [Amycolatopsis methanolica]AIJ24476.1 Barstar (barnase inhibitor) [Amycolatopsis methanolica 239]
MKIAELDGRRITDLASFHQQASELLDFGPYYGRNFDALWDRLSRDVERPVRVRWLHASTSGAALGEATFATIVDIFESAAREDREYDAVRRLEFELVDP